MKAEEPMKDQSGQIAALLSATSPAIARKQPDGGPLCR
jgi:hypothetical protein